MTIKPLDFIRNVWIRGQLSTSSPAGSRIMPHLHEAKEIIRLASRPLISVSEMRGRGRGGPLTVTYIGLRYAKPFLKDLLFQESPVEEEVGYLPIWRYKHIPFLPSGDLLIVGAAKHLIGRLPHQQAFTTPEFVHFTLDVRGDWEDVERRFHKTVHKNDLRRIRKYGYDYDVSHDPRDFEEFYHRMYLPTMQDRHQDLSMPMTFGEAYQYLRHGLLFRIKRNGEWVAGGICHSQHETLVLDILGVKNGDAQLVKEGAMAARYYAAIHWANQHGYSKVNFRGSTACLESGQLQNKRKWGTSVSIPPYLHRRVWIKVQCLTPAVSRFLKDTPFIIVDENDKLHGQLVVDNPHKIPPETQEEWQRRYETPGLESLLVRSVSSFVQESASVTGFALDLEYFIRP